MKINDEGTSNAAHWHERAMKAESQLAEAEALLREIAGHRQAVAFFAPQLAGVIAALDCIDAHLARKP
jgi:hypothetical protein